MSRFSLLFLIFIPLFSLSSAAERIPRLETYFMATQVDELLGSPELRTQALHCLQDIGITKVYLEFLRSGYVPKQENFIAARDLFNENEIEVATGITTTRGENFGVASNQPGWWLNFEEEKTQEDLRRVVRENAKLVRELMIDDFFATNDTSESSTLAKGDRSWEEYRMDLMMRIGRECVIEPALEVNPNMKFVLKFPQWYDRFHKFGYDVVHSPQQYDRIWVGTETRNPETKRFGFTMPTEGYINWRWLSSLSGEKIAGGWYDFGDCTPVTYLMQAYQTTLAGAEEIILFEAGSILANNACMSIFLQRRDALWALGEILRNQKAVGMLAYKPPHSEGSDVQGGANLYIFDYLATLGLAPLPVAVMNDDSPCIFLPRQAIHDSTIATKIQNWMTQGKTLVMTPDFLAALNDPQINEMAGFAPSLELNRPLLKTFDFLVQEENVKSVTEVEVRPISAPETAEVLCSALIAGENIPLLTQKSHSNGRILTLNLSTFAHEEFAPGREEFLPPRPLSVNHWPEAVVQLVRTEILKPFGVRVQAPNQVGLYLFNQGITVLSNFNAEPVDCMIEFNQIHPESVQLHDLFPHVEGAKVHAQGNEISIRLPAWELVVLKHEKDIE